MVRADRRSLTTRSVVARGLAQARRDNAGAGVNGPDAASDVVSYHDSSALVDQLH